jgi:hypothetical protein
MDFPFPHLLTHFRHRVLAYCWTEVDEVFPPTILASSGSKSEPEKVKLLIGVMTFSVIVFAVNNLCLMWV